MPYDEFDNRFRLQGIRVFPSGWSYHSIRGVSSYTFIDKTDDKPASDILKHHKYEGYYYFKLDKDAEVVFALDQEDFKKNKDYDKKLKAPFKIGYTIVKIDTSKYKDIKFKKENIKHDTGELNSTLYLSKTFESLSKGRYALIPRFYHTHHIKCKYTARVFSETDKFKLIYVSYKKESRR